MPKQSVSPPHAVASKPGALLTERHRPRFDWRLIRARLLQIGLGSAGLALLAWAFYTPLLRDTEGDLTGRFSLALAGSVVLLIVGLTIRGAYRHFGLWLSLALLGQAVTFQIIDAGKAIHWQHYMPLSDLVTWPKVLWLIALFFQTALVVIGLRDHWRQIQGWLRHTLSPWQWLGLGAVFVLPGAAVQRVAALYCADLLMAATLQAVNLGTIVLVAWTLPEEGRLWLRRCCGGWLRETDGDAKATSTRSDYVPVLAMVWVMLLVSWLAYAAYEQHPHITDEVGYLLHARLLANGSLAIPAPPVPDAFEMYLLEVKDGLWYAPTPPGWPAVLALGMRLGIPWMVNPFLAGLNILLAYHIVCDLYDRRTARLAVALMSVSPWYLFMGMNIMTHTFSLTCALGATVLIIRARQTDRIAWAGLAGGLVGMGSVIRPLDGLIVGVLLGVWVIGVGGRRLKFTALAAFAVGALVVGGTVLPYNATLTGQPTTFPLNAYLDEHLGVGKNDYGFGSNRGYDWPLDAFPGHSPFEGLINANLNTFSINIELFGWSIGSLLLIGSAVLTGVRHKSDTLMLAVGAAVIGAYFPYYFSGGPDFGARYWFLALLPCVVLTVRGLQWLAMRLDAEHVLAALLALCLLTLVNYIPWRAIDKYHHYWGMRPEVRGLAHDYQFGRSLILIQAAVSHPDYASAAVYNPLDWQADAPIYAWDRSPAVRAQLLTAYADRPVWILAGPGLTMRGFQVVAGPMSAAALQSGGTTLYPSAAWSSH